MEGWIHQHLEIKLNIREYEVLFGLTNTKNDHIEPINVIIIIKKWYINSQRSLDKQLYFIELLNIIREQTLLEIKKGKNQIAYIEQRH